MVRERIPRNPSIELVGIVRVLSDWAEVVYSIQVVMAFVEEAADIGTLVAVERLDAGSGEAHDDEMVGDVGEV